MRCVGAAFGQSARAMSAAGRSRPRAVFARQACLYLLHVVFSVPQQEIATLFGKDRTTVAHACRRLEERRDEPAFDAFMHELETAVRALDSAIALRTKHEHISDPAPAFLREDAPW